MKKLALTFALALGVTFVASAQKFALVDMDYILKAIPAYETANEQLDQLSKKWQKEVEAKISETQTLYKNYQTELVFLSDEMKAQREAEVVAKEKEANELKRKYFGVDGELYKKRESLMKPIHEEIFTAVQAVATEKGYQLIIDKSSDMSLVFAAPKIDVSDEVLEKLGYSK